jgi:hypothetical protein
MRRRYFKLSALLVAFFVVSLGVAPLLADDNVQPVEIKFEGTKVNHRAVFQLNFASLSRFIRMAYQRVSDVTPFTPPAPPVFDPIDDDEFFEPIMWLGKPGQKNDPREVPSTPGISDGVDPIF